MSKFSLEYDFNELKFNLYEILNVSRNETKKHIKKKYRKLVTKFHPDKNNEVEEDIFNHLTIANQVLTNTFLREKYDLWLDENSSSSHNDLKNNFNKNNFKTKTDYKTAKILYEKNSKLLDEKHKIKEDNTPILHKYKLLEKNRGVLKIVPEKFRNNSDFNTKFQNRKKPENVNLKNDKLISYHNNKIQCKYASTKNYSDLYVNDSIVTDKFSSLDNAFKLIPNLKYDEKDIKSEYINYKSNTEKFSKMKSENFLKTNYEEW